jgi:sporulation protein YlmC with PRC-barrel domain
MVMAANLLEPTLRYVDPDDVSIEGARCAGMKILGTAGKLLGTLQGFVVDPVTEQLRYLVVRTSGLLGRTALLPFQSARVDMINGAIEVAADVNDLRRKRDHIPPMVLARS